MIDWLEVNDGDVCTPCKTDYVKAGDSAWVANLIDSMFETRAIEFIISEAARYVE